MNRSKRTKIITIFLLYIFFPTIVLANAGTPLIWFSLLHLILINAIIGYLESAILSRFKILHHVWLILLANYVSMIIGFYAISHFVLTKTQYGRDIWNANSTDFLPALLISFVATIVIEYPLYYASLKDKKQKDILLKPFLIANISTNLIMACIYYLFIKNG